MMIISADIKTEARKIFDYQYDLFQNQMFSMLADYGLTSYSNSLFGNIIISSYFKESGVYFALVIDVYLFFTIVRTYEMKNTDNISLTFGDILFYMKEYFEDNWWTFL